MTTVEQKLGMLFMIDGEVWRVCCIASDGADLHMVNGYRTKHLSMEQWERFTDQNKSIGRYD